MSYDFKLFRPRAGQDPNIPARADSNGLPTTPADPKKEALKRQVADALIAHNSQLEVFQFHYEEIAKFRNISIDEAHLKYRHLEINGPAEDGNGIQITLFDDEASVTVPFWHEGEQAAETFREIWSYLEIIFREAGYLVYDPQLDRVFDPSKDFDNALSSYTGTVQAVNETFPIDDNGTEKKPWWKFW